MTDCGDTRFGSSPSSRSKATTLGKCNGSPSHRIRGKQPCDGGRRRLGSERACIRLSGEFSARALEGLAEFSHIEVLFVFHQVDPASVIFGARHPRNNPSWPAVGIFAQRARSRLNRLGSTICRTVRVVDTQLFVADLDAIGGTPVLESETRDAGVSATRAGTAARVVP
jgi:tRNA (Thr-GGU) A37 N-methylase